MAGSDAAGCAGRLEAAGPPGAHLPAWGRPDLGDAPTATTPARAIVPDALDARGSLDGGPTDRDDVGLRGRIVDGETASAGLAVARAGVTGGSEDGLALEGSLFEDGVLELHGTWLGGERNGFAETPARRDQLVGVILNDLVVLQQRAIGRVGSLVDVEASLGGECGDVLDVESSLPGARACWLTPSDVMDDEASRQLADAVAAEVAVDERLDIAHGEGFELEDRHTLALAKRALCEELVGAVASRELVVSLPVVGDRRLPRRAAGEGTTAR